MSNIINLVRENLSLLQAVELAAAGTVLYFAVGIIYNLFFHPLRNYPGPFAAKLNTWYAAWHAYKGDIHLDMHQCHQKYGPYVRYAPNRLLINTQQALTDIYAVPKNVKKAKQYQVLVHKGVNTLTLTDKKEHARRRRILATGFSDQALKSFEPTVIMQIDRLMDWIGEQAGSGWSPSLNMSRPCNYVAFDIMSNVIFGHDFNLVKDPKYQNVVAAIEASNVRIGTQIQMDNALRLFRLDKLLFPTAIRARNEFTFFLAKLLYKRFGGGRQGPMLGDDMVSRLINENEEILGAEEKAGQSKKLTMDEITAEGATLVVAGSDTTSTALAGFMFYISRMPEVRERATKEVRDTFSNRDDIKAGSMLTGCTYLMACINETLRMSPSVGAAPWREVESQGLDIEGNYLPGGVEIGTSFHAMHHNPEYHREPDVYNPDRWLADTKYGPDPRKAFFPFSLGMRGCLGKSLALQELQCATARLLYDFDIKEGEWEGPGKPETNAFPLYDHVTAAKRGPFVQFKRAQV